MDQQTMTTDRPADEGVALRDDLLNSADEIADFLGWPRQRVYNEARPERAKATGFPVFRIGGSVTARRSTLAVWIRGLEQRAVAS